MKTLPSSRLRQWLLLALRCLLLLLLIGAFARPMLRGSSAAAAAKEEGLRLVLLLDTSYSMGYRVAGTPRIELARRAGRRILDALGPEDRVAVAAFSDRPSELAWAGSREEASQALDAPITRRTTDADAALEAAVRFLDGEPAARRGVVLLSDNAGRAFRSKPKLREGMPVLALDWKDHPENAWAAGLSIEGDRRLDLSAEFGASSRRSAAARLWLSGRLAGERSVRIPGRAAFEVEPSTGWTWGRVELPPDALAADDRIHFVRRLEPLPKVLILSLAGDYFEPGRGGRFLRRMFLDPEGALLPYAADFLDLRRLRDGDLAPYRAVVLAAGPRLPAEQAGLLRRFVQDGGGLWVLLDRDLSQRALAGIEDILPAEAGPMSSSRDPHIKIGEPPAASAWRFDWGDFELDRLEASRAYALRLNPGAKIWMRRADGRPLLVARPYGKGRCLIWSAPLDPGWTNLALKPVFAAWLNMGLGHLTRSTRARRTDAIRVGESWSYAPRGPLSGEAWIETPDRRRVRVFGKAGRIRFDGADRPGIYWFEHSGEREPFAVNLDAADGESDLTPISPFPFERLDPEDPALGLRERFFGREVRWAFLYAFLFIMGAEMWLGGGRRDG